MWAIILQMALLTFVQVILRYLFHNALSWAEELLRFEVIFVAFMGAAMGVKYGTHIGVDFLYQLSPARMKSFLKMVERLLTSAFSFFLFYLAVVTVLKVKASGLITPALRIPAYIPYLPVILGSLIMGIRSGLKIGELFSNPGRGLEEKKEG